MLNIEKYLINDLRKPHYRTKTNPLAGHCYVACEVLFHLYLGKYKSYHIKHENESHWFLREIKTNKVVDPTVSQFKTVPRYSDGVGKGFLTKQPSKRAQIVLRNITHSKS